MPNKSATELHTRVEFFTFCKHLLHSSSFLSTTTNISKLKLNKSFTVSCYVVKKQTKKPTNKKRARCFFFLEIKHFTQKEEGYTVN